jgi:signal transduction histidine kinase
MAGSSALKGRLGRSAPLAGDWVVAALVVVLQMFAPRTGSASTASVWAAVLIPVMALGQGLAVALVRRRPLAAGWLVLVCYAGQSLMVGVVPPFASWVVIWSRGSGRTPGEGSVKLSAVVAAVTCAVLVVAELTREGSGASALLVGVTVVVTLAAVLLRSERARVDAVRRQGAAEERLRIARDLHDLVGHGLSVVAVQSSTARMALDSGDPATARVAMVAVEASSRTAMGELRQMLGVLTDEPGGSPAPGLGDLTVLVDNVRAGGVLIDLQSAGELDAVPRAAQLGAYRIVQEAITNAVKHAPGSLVSVRVRAVDRGLTVEVESSGASRVQQEGAGGGSGLDGIRARVAALSGTVFSEPTADGWLIRAVLPLPHRDATRDGE